MSHNDTIVARATHRDAVVWAFCISGLKAREVAGAVLGKLQQSYADYLPFQDVNGTALDQGIAL